MAGNKYRREKQQALQAQTEAMIERKAELLKAGGKVTLDEALEKHKDSLDKCGDMRDRIDKLCALIGYDPYAELIYMTRYNDIAAGYVNLIGEVLECCDGYLEEQQEIELKELISFLKKIPLDPRGAAKIHMDLLKYRAPQLKASEVKQTVDQTVTINVQKFSGE